MGIYQPRGETLTTDRQTLNAIERQGYKNYV